MESTNRLSGNLRSGESPKPTLPSRRTQPVRLPRSTDDLVNRLLALRCGAYRAGA